MDLILSLVKGLTMLTMRILSSHAILLSQGCTSFHQQQIVFFLMLLFFFLSLLNFLSLFLTNISPFSVFALQGILSISNFLLNFTGNWVLVQVILKL